MSGKAEDTDTIGSAASEGVARQEQDRQSPPDVGMLLEGEEAVLLELRNRYLWLRAIEKELSKRIGGGRFKIENDLIWMTLLDSRDALFLHFASWAKALVQKGGLFSQVRAHFVNRLYVAKPKGKLSDLDASRWRHRREKFESMFPDAAKRGKVQPQDIDALKARFFAHVKPVIEDRDAHRAHPYEKQDKGEIRMLRLDEFEPALNASQDLLNGLRLCLLNSSLRYHDHLSLAGAEDTAKDLVDLAMFHSVQNMLQRSGANAALMRGSGEWWWQHQARWRDRLQAEHERLAKDHPDLAINDDAVLDAADLDQSSREVVVTSTAKVESEAKR